MCSTKNLISKSQNSFKEQYFLIITEIFEIFIFFFLPSRTLKRAVLTSDFDQSSKTISNKLDPIASIEQETQKSHVTCALFILAAGGVYEIARGSSPSKTKHNHKTEELKPL